MFHHVYILTDETGLGVECPIHSYVKGDLRNLETQPNFTLSHYLISNPTSGLAEKVSALYKQCHDHPDARQICQTPYIRHCLGCIGDVDQIIEHSTCKIPSREHVERFSWETS